ncbi:FkbM family methyltransferase [Pectobacterium versatile]|uniref:FkbM family methyltransferase n=1 Tax=Pectobacterium versatile TaxID=2488639 RepID=UPI001B397B63|nr:FkbM family methyltransferase [Pectobacterium versatile]MBQ4767261.1 FkbM family methyltransferase [Pectobacterium versatile]
MNNKDIIKFCNDFLDEKKPRFVFGATAEGRFLAGYLNLDGIIDDYTSEKSIGNVPVVKLNEVPNNALVVSTVVFGKPLTAKKILDEKNIKNIDFFIFVKIYGIQLPSFPFFFNDRFENEYITNKEKYENVRGLLSDNESCQTFDNLIKFRLTSDISYLSDFSLNLKNQYFDTPLNEKNDEDIFIDAGSFDGATTLEFIKRYPNYKSVHIFEPDPLCMEKIKENLNGVRNIEFYPYAVSNENKASRFSSQGSLSKISDFGDTEIHTVQLDNILKVKPSFIKMDIEGHEIKAIEGTKEIISNYGPKLAICAYHRIDDFWRIPELVYSYNKSYNLYMRHYTEGLLETVYYFLPK